MDYEKIAENLRNKLSDNFSKRELAKVFGNYLKEHGLVDEMTKAETKELFNNVQEYLSQNPTAPKIQVSKSEESKNTISYAYKGIKGLDLSYLTETITEVYADKLDELGLPNASEEAKKRVLYDAFIEVAEKELPDDVALYPEEKIKELFELIKDFIDNYGVLTPAIKDPKVTEVMVNGPGEVWVENDEGLMKTDIYFTDQDSLKRIITKIASTVSRRIDESAPILDCRLKDGSRVNATLSPPTLNGPSLTIRKFPEDRITIEKLIEWKSLTPRAAKFLEHCVYAALNILVAGGTGSGKLMTNVTSIPTPTGQKRLGDLELGDMIFDENGKPTRVNGIFEPEPPSVYTVKFDDGTELVACGEHLWETWTRRARISASRNEEGKAGRIREEFLTAGERIAVKQLQENISSSTATLGEICAVLPDTMYDRVRNASKMLTAVSEQEVRTFSVEDMHSYLTRNDDQWNFRLNAADMIKNHTDYDPDLEFTKIGITKFVLDMTDNESIAKLAGNILNNQAKQYKKEHGSSAGIKFTFGSVVDLMLNPGPTTPRGLTESERFVVDELLDSDIDFISAPDFIAQTDKSLKSRVENALNAKKVSLQTESSVSEYDVSEIQAWLDRSDFKNDQRHKKVLPQVVDTDHIYNTLKTDSGHINHSIPVSGVWEYPEAKQLVDPYVLGAWLGDGTSNSGGLTSIDPEVWKEIEERGYEISHSPTEVKAHYIKGLIGQLKKLGVAKTQEQVDTGVESKFIPDEYLLASEEQRRDLLAGLMDTDGGVSKDTGFCEFYNSNKVLAEQVRTLLHSLGYKTRFWVKENPSYVVDGVRKVSDKSAYTVSFVSEVPVFKLPRKEQVRIDGLAKVDRREFVNDHRYIVDVVRWEDEHDGESYPKMRCLQVDSPSALFLISDAGIPTHNTSMLNALGNFIPAENRIVTIEDAAELQLQHDHVLKHESKPPNIEGGGEITIGDLLKASLRQRPDRIVVGECRSGEAYDMLQAMNTGHDGSMTTLHANTPKDALSRLNNLVLQAGNDLSEEAINGLIASALDLIVYCGKMPVLGQPGKFRRMVTHITEVQNVEGSVILTNHIFKSEIINGEYYLMPSGLRAQFEKTKFYNIGLVVDDELFQVDPADKDLARDQAAEAARQQGRFEDL